jgi:hypothetical protein
MTKEEILRIMKLFNEKAEKLLNSSFTKNLEGSKLTISAKIKEAVKVERLGPKGESIDSFILTYRFFIQNNEVSSFGNFAKIYENLLIPKVFRDKFIESRNELNQFLDEPLNIEYNNEKLTRRKIHDVFIYGGYAHANLEKKKIYDAWMKFHILNEFLINEFVNIVAFVLNSILEVRSINEDVISILSS